MCTHTLSIQVPHLPRNGMSNTVSIPTHYPRRPRRAMLTEAVH